MAWLFLLVAGLCEIAWAIGLKYTEGFSRLLPMIGTVAAMGASIGFLGLALLWQIIHAACLGRSIFGSAGIAAAAVER